MVIVNVGHKDYGYIRLHQDAICNLAVPEENRKEKLRKAVKLAAKTLTIIEIAIIALDLFAQTGFAHAIPASSDIIDLSPLDTLQHEIWLLMLKGILYVAVPVYAWCGYIFAFAGHNAGKRTTAKWVALAMTGGIAFVCGAPWAA